MTRDRGLRVRAVLGALLLLFLFGGLAHSAAPNRIRRRLGGGTFTPKSLGGLVQWCRADQGVFQDAALTTPAVADGDPVGGWQDQSGLGNHLTQATAGSRPALKLSIQNGRSILRFDGLASWLSNTGLTLNQPSTLIVVASAVSASAVYYSDGNTTKNTRVLQENSVTVLRIFSGTSLDQTVASLAGFHVLGGVFNGAASISLYDGLTLAGNAGASNAAGIRIGASGPVTSGFLPGDIGEVLNYNRALSLGEIGQVYRYAKAYWGTP